MPTRKRTVKSSRTAPKKIELTARRAEAVNLRLQGWSFEQIGASMEISPQAAHQLVDGAMDAMLREPIEKLRQLELARLDELQTAIAEEAMGGNLGAISAWLAIHDRRAKLAGLYQPQTFKVEGEVEHKHSGEVSHKIEIVFIKPEVRTIEAPYMAPIGQNGHAGSQ